MRAIRNGLPYSFAEVLPFLCHHGVTIYRQSAPHKRYDLDAAEGLTIWEMNAETDDLTKDYRFGVDDLVATDWCIEP